MSEARLRILLPAALERTDMRLAERPDLRPLVSIRNQLEYLSKAIAGEENFTRLKDINVGLIAVREIEGWDNDLADLLHKISAEIRVIERAETLRRSG